MNHDRARALIARQFEDGPLPPLEDQALRAHVRGCAECRAYYDRVAELEHGLGGDAAVIERLQARGAPVVVPERPARRRWAVGLALAAGILVGVGLWQLRSPPPAPEFGVKGAGGRVGSKITLFRKPGDGPPARVAERIAPTDGLLVSYTNPKDGPGYLGVVARDAGGRLYWIVPAWTDAAQRPESAAVQTGVADEGIGQVVHHALTVGRLEVCGMFTEAARSIPEWDAALTRAWPPAGADCRAVEVAP